jgi:hypothetical protein
MSYREAPSEPRFVCLSCEERTVHAGVCPGCCVQRLPLADPRVREELAAQSERRLHARAGREQLLLGMSAFLVAVPLRWMGGWVAGTCLWIAAGVIGTGLLWRLVARYGSRSALHVFRRRSMS